jgi:hypothetical protein
MQRKFNYEDLYNNISLKKSNLSLSLKLKQNFISEDVSVFQFVFV